MGYFEALLYGMVQGLTEYLPISSSAHLILLPHFLGEKDPGLTFDVFLHLGTFIATVSYFWRDWLGVVLTLPALPQAVRVKLKNNAPAQDQQVHWSLIVIATVPALFVGAVLHKIVESELRAVMVTVVTLTVGGGLLYFCDAFFSKRRALTQMHLKDALFIGIAQAFALVPGVSRSGITITAGRALSFDRVSAARFSFLISGPVTLAALVFQLRNWGELFNGPVGLGPIVIAGVSSFCFGVLAISGLLKLVKNFGYLSFALYRVGLAIFVYWHLVA